MATTNNKVLIRLKDISNENSMIEYFYTENPSEFLKMYIFCKEKDIFISDNNKEKLGKIKDIEVFFGGKEEFPCIDVWVEVY